MHQVGERAGLRGGECSPAGEGQRERGGRLKVNLNPGSLGFPCRETEICVLCLKVALGAQTAAQGSHVIPEV